tara:strand:- start:100 stop:654 length:555 start_codon:yes stop_codon:yes gene_type:complete
MNENSDPIMAARRYDTRGIGLPNPKDVERWSLFAPVGTHRSPVTCASSGCGRYLDGWTTVLVEDASPQFDAAADHIRRVAGKRYAEARAVPGGVEIVDWNDVNEREVNIEALPVQPGATYFMFPPGQECFESHTDRNDREPIFQHAVGFGSALHDKRVMSGDEFVERSQESFGKTADLLKRERG